MNGTAFRTIQALHWLGGGLEGDWKGGMTALGFIDNILVALGDAIIAFGIIAIAIAILRAIISTGDRDKAIHGIIRIGVIVACLGGLPLIVHWIIGIVTGI